MSEPNIQNQSMESFFETTECGVMRHSVNGKRILGINEAALKILGYESLDELMTDGFDLIAATVIPEDRDRLRTAIKNLTKTGDSTSVEYRVRHKDGKIIDVMGGVKLLQQNGELIYQRFLMDCTEQRLLAQQEMMMKEKHQREMISALSIDYDSVFLVNLDTGYGYAYRMSESVQKRFGSAFIGDISMKDSIEFYIRHSVHPEDAKLFREVTARENIISELSKKQTVYLTYRICYNGATIYFRLKIVRVGDWKQAKKIVLGFRSVDEEVRQELEKKKTLEEALARAESAARAKTAFLNNMSHDIRTPMNAIIGFTTLAISHLDQVDRVEDYLEKIRTSGNQLLSLINDILDMSRIESGKMQLEENECSLSEIINELVNIFEVDIQKKQLNFVCDTAQIMDDNIVCDKLHLNQILINCLGNAVKFTEAGGSVTLRVSQAPCETAGCGRYCFQIQDTGIGMSKEFIQHIFEPFERERTSTISRIQGTGLGMAITKNIVDMMHGTICVESEVGKGSEFRIDLQFHVAEHDLRRKDEGEHDQNQEKVMFTGKKILLVEDVELNREIAETMLEEAGFQVDSVQNGLEAVERIMQTEAGTYDLILMDIQMPVMNGYEASRQIRKLSDPRKAGIAILAMTADAFEEDRQRALDAGMNGHISKPIKIQKLFTAINSIFSI
jgi:PAS domain S-box-containing protein